MCLSLLTFYNRSSQTDNSKTPPSNSNSFLETINEDSSISNNLKVPENKFKKLSVELDQLKEKYGGSFKNSNQSYAANLINLNRKVKKKQLSNVKPR